MGQRGRKPTAALATLEVTELQKPEPPSHLNEAQREIWNNTVGHLPADFFRPETFDLLSQYCRHVDYSVYMGRQADAAREGGKEQDVIRCMKRHKEEGQAALTIAQKLGFTTPNYERQNKKPGRGKAGLDI